MLADEVLNLCRLNPYVWLSNPIFWIKGPTIGLLHAIFWDVSYRMPRLKLSQVPGWWELQNMCMLGFACIPLPPFCFDVLEVTTCAAFLSFPSLVAPNHCIWGIFYILHVPLCLIRPHSASPSKHFFFSKVHFRGDLPCRSLQKFTLLIPNLGL